MAAARRRAVAAVPDIPEPAPPPAAVPEGQGVLLPALVPDPPPVVPVPCGRFDWERVVREWPIGKGAGVMTGRVKLVALICATHADPDGTRVFPGEEGLAKATGQGGSTCRRHLVTLVSLGLLVCLRRGGGGKASEYRLTVPEGHELRSLR